MVYVIVYVGLFRYINELFNFGINNVVGKPIIDKGLFYNNIFPVSFRPQLAPSSGKHWNDKHSEVSYTFI